MARYRKKPVVIEAVQFDPENKATHEHLNFSIPAETRPGYGQQSPFHNKWWLTTLEGPLTVSPGDWIITGVKGEHYPCKPDIFEATYDKVED